MPSSFLISPTTVSDFIVLTIASNTHNPISNYDGISEEMNMEIYKCLYKKMELPAFVFSFHEIWLIAKSC